MSTHQTTIIWERKGQAFNTKNYCRDHLIRLQDGQMIAASGAAAYLPPGTVGAQTADPQELFVASWPRVTCYGFLQSPRASGS
ncbi:MAG: hypothetical protein M3120_09785 [Pseudomonadota bacterium]|nr:hypothetical protein [Pseudomonadota bacterium]